MWIFMNYGSLGKHYNTYNTNSAHITPTYTQKHVCLSTFLVLYINPFLIYLPHLHFNIIFTYVPELLFKTSNSSEHQTFYLKTVSNIESLSQLQLKINISPPPPHFTYQKLPQLQQKNQQISWYNEEKYSLIHLPQNLQQKNDIYTHPNYPLI